MNRCMLCGGNEFEFVHNLRDDSKRHVYQCRKCGHVQVLPLPTVDEDYQYYQTGVMYSGMFVNKSDIEDVERTANRARKFAENQHKKLIPFLHADWKILEIGSAFGWLVEYMQKLGYDFNGVEISELYREAYHRRTGKNLYNFNLLWDNQDTIRHYGVYDCIVLFHTLEHINDPVKFLLNARKLLKIGGVIYIEVPNNDDWMMGQSQKYMDFHFARSHVSYFTKETLELVLGKSGFCNISVEGNQIYSIENVFQWFRKDEPFLEYHQIDVPEPLEWLNELYKRRIEEEMKSFAIIGKGTKVAD
ncbi:MAG: class I SAM-dependent methyltransferase [Alistipes sp.]|nr:class I SAM-dependent methyltransferase [Alistipes sp.]